MKRRKLDLESYGVSNKNKAREEDEYDVLSKDKNSEGEEKCVKVSMCNEDKGDKYKGLAKVDGSGEVSEESMTKNINNDTSLDTCKGSPTS